MHEQYKSLILAQLREANIPVERTSSGKARKLLSMALGAKIGIERAEMASSMIDITVDDELFADSAFISAVIDAFSDLIAQQSAFADTAFSNPDSAFANLLDGFSLTLVPPQ